MTGHPVHQGPQPGQRLVGSEVQDTLVLPRQNGFVLGQGLMEGIGECADLFGVALAGGDTNTWDGPLVISITVLGEPTPKGPVLRSGALPGDWIIQS